MRHACLAVVLLVASCSPQSPTGQMAPTTSPVPTVGDVSAASKPALPATAGPSAAPGPTNATASLSTNAPGAIQWDEAARHVGEAATVEGPVVGVKHAKKSSGQPTFLNIGRAYPDPARLTGVIWGDDLKRFSAAPETLYDGRVVRITGLLRRYRGGVQIVIKDPAAIVVVR